MLESLILFEQVENSAMGMEKIREKLKRRSLSPKYRAKLKKKIKRLALTRDNAVVMLKSLN